MRFLRTQTASGPAYSLLTFNREVGRLLGWKQDEIADLDWSRGFYRGVAEEDVPAVERALPALQKPGDYSAVDYCVRDRAGNLRYFSGNYQLVRENAEGQIIQNLSFDITGRIELEQQLARMSFEDSLTSVYNRSEFNQDREHYGLNRQLGVACFDINGLKEINDRNGHSAGDAVIRETARSVSSLFAGKIYRMGGDEFTAVDDERTESNFRSAVQAVSADLERKGIQVSAGLCWRGSGCDVVEQSHEADLLMYQAKARYYEEDPHDRRQRKGAAS